MLNAAFQAADAPRVAAFFKGFLAEEVATGNAPAPQPEPGITSPPRQAAVSLDTLAAPGRAKPASGDSSVPADKPVFTHAQIAQFYRNTREAGLGKGPYAGREADRKRDEVAIFTAQAEGRIR